MAQPTTVEIASNEGAATSRLRDSERILARWIAALTCGWFTLVLLVNALGGS